jgi:hypothetical protein
LFNTNAWLINVKHPVSSSAPANEHATGLSAMMRAFKDHPNSVGQNYFQHFKFSASVSMALLYSSMTALLHAIAPPLCQASTSKAINKLHAQMQHQKSNKVNE